MQSKYIFLSDIDGTLLRGSSGICRKVVQAAHKYVKSGGLLSLCTGRAPMSSRWVAKELHVNMPCILYTGAAIYDFKAERCIWSRHFSTDIMAILEQLYIRYPAISILVYTHDTIFMLRANDHLMSRGIREEIPCCLSNLTEVRGDLLKLLLICDDINVLQQCKEDLFSSNQTIFAFSSTHFAEVVPAGAGKDNAMKALSELYEVPLSGFFVAGDGMTDLPMIELGGYSFAPVTSPKLLLDKCDSIIPPCEEGGMEKAFKYALNIMRRSNGSTRE